MSQPTGKTSQVPPGSPPRARDNPFRASRIEALPFRPQGLDLPPGTTPRAAREALWNRFEAQGHQGLIVGPKGTGKTTLLDFLAERLEAEGFTVHRWKAVDGRFEVDAGDAWPSFAKGNALILDGLEALSRKALKRVLRKASQGEGAFLATTHKSPITMGLRSAWHLAPLRRGPVLTRAVPVLYRATTDRALLRVLVDGLLEGYPGVDVPDELLDELFRRHRGNVRAVLGALYGRWGAGGF